VGDFRAVICGGGISAVEGLLRLRRLAGDAVDVTLVAPKDELVYRPLAVKEPFALSGARRYPLSRVLARTNADRVADTLAWVDPDGQRVHTPEGRAIPYDALLVAVGARSVPAFENVTLFTDRDADATYRGIVQDAEEGYLRRLALLVPDGPVWQLPIYELALMTAERIFGMGIVDFELALVTPEPRPLAAFGEAASDAVERLLDDAGVRLFTSASIQVPERGRVIVRPHGEELRPERAVALPRIAAPTIRGLRPGSHGFVAMDELCRVPGAGGRVFVAGDAADFPIKHGGLGAQQADVAAAGMARLAGADVEPHPYRPVLRGMLLTGRRPLYLSARMVGGRGFESEALEEPDWPHDDKVVAEELGPFLAELDATA
jgi:sulfide:quinone oxidoreductase